MVRQVLTISPDGSVAGLQVKPGKGFDLRQMGKAQITRASEVLFNETAQMWWVEVREGRHAGKPLTVELVGEAGLPGPYSYLFEESTGCLLFHDYDEGVKWEIAVLDGLRRQGKL